MSPSLYVDETTFQREGSKLFRTTWLFAGFTRDLKEHNDYICCDAGGQSVAVQNFKGKLSGLHNVCSHRFSKIHADKKGHGSLQCPYHGLTYDAEGIPVAIPPKLRTPQTDDAFRKSLALDRWAVETCGDLVFIRRGEQGISLREFLGEAHTTIERIGSALGPLIDENEIIVEANWKIAVENTLESAHVSSVHPESFARLDLADACDRFAYQGRHSSWTTPVGKDVAARWQKVGRPLEGRPLKIDGYFHQFVFPNLTIATTYGSSFSIQLFHPLSPSRTRFTSYVFATKLDEGKRNESVVAALNESVVSFNRAVFEEDAKICKAVHEGSAEAEGRGFLSLNEQRVFAFQQAYLERLT